MEVWDPKAASSRSVSVPEKGRQTHRNMPGSRERILSNPCVTSVPALYLPAGTALGIQFSSDLDVHCKAPSSIPWYKTSQCFLLPACFFLEITLMSLVILSLDTSLHCADTSCDVLGSSEIALTLGRNLICRQSLTSALNLLAASVPLVHALWNWLQHHWLVVWGLMSQSLSLIPFSLQFHWHSLEKVLEKE